MGQSERSSLRNEIELKRPDKRIVVRNIPEAIHFLQPQLRRWTVFGANLGDITIGETFHVKPLLRKPEDGKAGFRIRNQIITIDQLEIFFNNGGILISEIRRTDTSKRLLKFGKLALDLISQDSFDFEASQELADITLMTYERAEEIMAKFGQSHIERRHVRGDNKTVKLRDIDTANDTTDNDKIPAISTILLAQARIDIQLFIYALLKMHIEKMEKKES